MSRARSRPKRQTPHALLTPLVSRVFEELGVGASLWREGFWPQPIHEEQGLLAFEAEHGVQAERFAYNDRTTRRALKAKAPVLGEHRGLSDYFVPIVDEQRVVATLVTGPFLTRRPTSIDVLERWRALTGRQGHPADGEFSDYLSTTLSTLVLEAEHLEAFRHTLECLARLMAGQGSAEHVLREAEAAQSTLRGARRVESIWNAARAMVDATKSHAAANSYNGAQLESLGLSSYPQHVSVALFVSRDSSRDPVEDLLQRHWFQRACAELTGARGNAVSGRIGDYGVSFLVAGAGSAERVRRKLIELGQQAQSIARRHGLLVHLGLASPKTPLAAQFQSSLAAAEASLSRGVFLSEVAATPKSKSLLSTLRRELAEFVTRKPEELPARFDRFLEAVAVHCRHRWEPAQAHAEAAFERIFEALEHTSTIGAKDLQALERRVVREAGDAQTLSQLFAVYRQAVRDVAEALEQPTHASHARSVRRAEEYLKQHYAERLRIADVARIAGFAPSHFSALFRREQRTTFSKYLTELRIQRAKELLASTSLNLDRVAELSGLSRRQYLTRVFKQRTDETPEEYRRRALVPHTYHPESVK